MLPEKTSNAPASKANILVVDDTHANLHFLSKLLSMQNYAVRPVPEGKLAVSSAKAAPPDLILLDIMMPDMSGYEVCEQLKAEERTRDIPIIFISVKNEVIDKVKAFSLGAVDYITKPFDIEEVLARVKTHLTLRRLQKTLEEKNQILEREILERTRTEAQLNLASSSLHDIAGQLEKTQMHLTESEKMADLGLLVAGIAHELNTPMGAIRSSAEHLQAMLGRAFEELPDFIRSLTAERQQDFFVMLKRATQQETGFKSTKEKRELRKILQQALEESDVADARRVAELLINLGVCADDLPEVLPRLHGCDHLEVLEMLVRLSNLYKSTSILNTAVEKALKVIQSLKHYARYDHTNRPIRSDVIQGIEAVLTLYQNLLKHGIEVQRHYQDAPPFFCYPDELVQVWANLIQNAAYAMQNRGILTIDVTQEEAADGHGQLLNVSISDTGAGIPTEIQEKIFEPFFTTKPAGEGNGLGLDIVKKIVAKHHGDIRLVSQPGRTTFSVRLPMFLEDPQPAQAAADV